MAFVKLRPRRGTEMNLAGKKLQQELRRTKIKLAEAEYLILHLSKHEGAEGWSLYLRKRLDKYRFTTEPSNESR